MTETLTKHERNLSAVMHASTFSRYFIPFGNFIIPLVLWTANKNTQPFVDHHGKQALNFQISLLLYSLVLVILSVPLFLGFLPNLFEIGFSDLESINQFDGVNINLSHRNWFSLWPLGIAGLLQLGLSICNIVFTIIATIKATEGAYYRYPLTINFIK